MTERAKFVGFFREIGFNPASFQDSIRDALLEGPPEHRDELIRYLRGGIKIIVVAGGAPDVLTRGRWIGDAESVYTDGTWVWRADLAYYLANYPLRLPGEFVERALQADFVVPDVPETRLREVDEYVTRTLSAPWKP
ncbi:hypothetical protein [Streptomyces sp. NPDC007088]|uniref:hypothetical protein n=1 Tax=Streptomyces sp. NPDC007088 TaxID=3364773 RepID=UPI0036B3563A